MRNVSILWLSKPVVSSNIFKNLLSFRLIFLILPRLDKLASIEIRRTGCQGIATF